MQQSGEIAWDPSSIMSVPPWSLRLFMIYIVVVFVVALVKSLRLGSHLWFLNRNLSRLKSSSERELPKAIGRAGFARNFREILQADLGENLMTPLRQAEADFLYLWQLSLLRAKSIKRLATLTILVSAWVYLMLSGQMLHQLVEQKVASLALTSGILWRNLTSLELGAFAVVVLYTLYAVFEGALRRRKVNWDYVLQRVEPLSSFSERREE